MSTRKERMDQITRVLADPIADLSFKEGLSLAYHTLRYEWLTMKQDRIDWRRRGHGEKIQQALEVANFKHEMTQL